MSMRPSLTLKIGQQLRMTPQLQQAIKLLQLSTLDLQQEIQAALDSNLMLEEFDDSAETAAASDADNLDETTRLDDPSEAHHLDDADLEQTPNADFEGPSANEFETLVAEPHDQELDGDRISDASELLQTDALNDDLPVDSIWEDVYDSLPTGLGAGAGFDEDSESFDARNSPQGTVQSHLLEQINLLNFTESDEVIALHIIDGLDQEGMLRLELQEIQEAMPVDWDVQIEEIEAVLHLIQHLDPLGIAARDLGECLLIQLQSLPNTVDAKLLAITLITDHLASLGNRDFAFLIKHLHVSEAQLQSAIELIQTLNPKPGAGLNEVAPQYVVPDVVVTKKNNRWTVELNPAINAKIRVNPEYSALIKRNDSSPDQAYQMQEARWFIKSLQQRNDTLLRVSTKIMEVQAGFLDHGDSAMKPLVLHDIAEDVGLHESTISRVTTQKYIDTPRGVYELKYFFSSHVSSHSGGEVSSTAIRAKIKLLISQENTRKPLSDSKLAHLLAEDNINVARRTVAKYREALMIPPSNERKQLS
jgi:RNA polymerase sigma-54 factor